MTFIEILLIAVGLSMDAFAVSLCRGLSMKKINYGQAFTIALFFGGFQALMPYLGWLLGRQFERYITRYDHWIAFALLAFLGIRMILEALKKGDEEGPEKLGLGQLLLLSIATSIDALAVGLTFAFVGDGIGLNIIVIGLTTAILCLCGVIIGNRFGMRYRSKAEFAGGAILILIGLNILLGHLGVLPW